MSTPIVFLPFNLKSRISLTGKGFRVNKKPPFSWGAFYV